MIRRALLVPVLMGGAFNPENVAGIVYRWVADDIAGNDGDAIETWTDRIASKALSQATEGLRPLLRKTTNGIGGKNALAFDGATSNRNMKTGAFSDLAQPNTIFAVIKSAIAAPAFTAAAYAYDSGIDTATKRHGLLVNSAVSDTWQAYAGALLATGDAADDSPHVFATHYNGASSSVRMDGTEIGTGDVGAQAMGSLNIGLFTTPGNSPWNGLIAEIIIYGSTLSDANRNAVEAYLKSYYGI